MIARVVFGSLCRLRFARLGVAVLCALLPVSTEGDEPTSLVQQLGDASFERREQAAEALVRQGIEAKAAIRAGLTDPDPEIRRRCRVLFARIRNEDREQRIEAFLADVGGVQDFELVAWPRFRALVGDDAASRGLFAQVYRVLGALFEAHEEQPDALAAPLATRLNQRLRGGVASNLDESRAIVVGGLFLAAEGRLTGQVQIQQQLISLMFQQPFQELVRQGPHALPAQKLLKHWFDRLTEPNVILQALNMGLYSQLPGSLVQELAARELKNRAGLPAARSMAILILARAEGQKHEPAIRAALDDERSVGQFTINVNKQPLKLSTQVRDVALATLVALRGESLAEYGFDRFKADPNYPNTPLKQGNYIELGFTSDESRQQAFQRWQKTPDKP